MEFLSKFIYQHATDTRSLADITICMSSTDYVFQSVDNRCVHDFFACGTVGPTWVTASSLLRFLDHTQQCTTVGRTPLDEWSARRRDLYLTTHNTHNRLTSMPPGGIRTHNLSRQAAADLCLRPRGHWDRDVCMIVLLVALWPNVIHGLLILEVSRSHTTTHHGR